MIDDESEEWCGRVIEQTGKAVRLDTVYGLVWLPLKYIEVRSRNADGSICVSVPIWLAEDRRCCQRRAA